MTHDDAARRAHYADLHDPAALVGGERLGIVLGNCQAESLRQALAGSDVRLLRVPPVHELEADDMADLHRVLASVDVLVAQPIRDDYRGLPLGTRQLVAASAATRTAVVPIVRHAGPYPWQAIVRPPSDPGAVPPVVPYHDLRLLAEAAGRSPEHRPADADADAIRAIGEASLAELRRREQRDDSVPISDALEAPGFDRMRTINHPGNPVWEALAERVHDRLGLGGAPLPLERQLLDAIHAPRERAVIEALGLDVEPREHWLLDGERIDPVDVRRAHLAWYRANPEVVAAGLERHAAAIATLGL